MVLPVIVAGGKVLAYGGAILSSALNIGSFAYDQYQRYERLKENERYWNDYYENTGITPLYPYRAGSYTDYVGSALQVSEGVLNLYRVNRSRFYK